MSSKWGRVFLLFGLTATCCVAQSSSFGQAAQGIATEMVGIARWLGIIMLIICGISIMGGGAHMVGKIGGCIVGLVLALFASPLVTWVQSL